MAGYKPCHLCVQSTTPLPVVPMLVYLWDLVRCRISSFKGTMIQKLDWTKLMENARPCTVHAHMPEFSIDSDLNMNAWCQNHGIVTAFEDIADFYPMSDDWVKIGSVKHKKIHLSHQTVYLCDYE